MGLSMSYCENWNLGNQCKIADIPATVISVSNKVDFIFDTRVLCFPPASMKMW